VPVAGDRYPTRLSTAGAAPLLQAARSLAQWTAPAGGFGAVWDYPQRFRRYRREYGLLDARDEAALNALASAAGPLRMAHGDLLAANVLQHAGAVSGVLDWEFTGRFLPGLDAALLWTTLGHLPAARQEAEQLAGTSVAERSGFWANVATVCVRELRTHGELPAGPLRATRLPYLQGTWATVQARIHELAGEL
jgi:aminoglycoside phosphotransferase (APT) family kinase protein